MKRRLAETILLLAGFLALAIPTGALPAVGEGAAPAITRPAAETSTLSEETSSPVKGSEETAAPRGSPPAETPVPLYEPEDAPAPSPVSVTGDGTRIVATTIESEAMLTNDTGREIDPDAVMAGAPPLSLPAEGYQVLILHTHATEAYTQTPEDPYEPSGDCRTTDPDHSVIRVGRELAEALEEQGLHVLHCTTLFDWPDYNGAYARSGEAIREYLEAYPGIRVVIDLHRDALGGGGTIYKTVANIDGVYAAQLMFVMGTDVNLEHPGWRDNLGFALGLQKAVCARYGTLMRPVTMSVCRYNQQMTPCSVLMEVGTSGNTLAEALCAVRLFAETAGPILASCVEPPV